MKFKDFRNPHTSNSNTFKALSSFQGHLYIRLHRKLQKISVF